METASSVIRLTSNFPLFSCGSTWVLLDNAASLFGTPSPSISSTIITVSHFPKVVAGNMSDLMLSPKYATCRFRRTKHRFISAVSEGSCSQQQVKGTTTMSLGWELCKTIHTFWIPSHLLQSQVWIKLNVLVKWKNMYGFLNYLQKKKRWCASVSSPLDSTLLSFGVCLYQLYTSGEGIFCSFLGIVKSSDQSLQKFINTVTKSAFNHLTNISRFKVLTSHQDLKRLLQSSRPFRSSSSGHAEETENQHSVSMDQNLEQPPRKLQNGWDTEFL